MEQLTQADYEKLHSDNRERINLYEKINTLSLITDEYIRLSSKQRIEISESAAKEKNIAFLMKAYKENIDLLESRI